MSEENYSLYATLGICKDATPQDIKKAYHRLALDYHPDRAGDAGTEKFKEIQNAYSILSDAKKRRLYDSVGDTGFDAVSRGGFEHIVVHPAFFVLALFIPLVLGILALIFFILIAIQLDRARNWHWAIVFVPIWCLDVFPLIIGAIVFVNEWNQSILGYIDVTVLLAFVGTTLTIMLRLQHIIRLWSVALIPLFILSTNIYMRCLVSTHQRQGKKMRDILRCDYWGSKQIQVLVSFALTTIFYVLFCLKLDGDPNYSFMVAFTPLLVDVGMQWFFSFWQTMKQSGWRVCSSGAAGIGRIIISSIPIALIVLFALYLDGRSISFAVVCIPVYLVLGLLLFGVCCGCCVLYAAKEAMQGGEDLDFENSTEPIP